MSHSALDSGDPSTLSYIVTHVFFPLRLPDMSDHSVDDDHALSRAITKAARLYSDHVSQDDLPLWNTIPRMLENLQAVASSESLDMSQTVSQFSSMGLGDVLAFPFRVQDVGVVFRRQAEVTIYESFEMSQKAQDVLATDGRLICSYPGPAIEIPNAVFHHDDFRSELANFLVRMDHDGRSAFRRRELSSEPYSEIDPDHPRYITELLTGILRGVGRPADISRINKRIGDDACNNGSGDPWRRSALWLLIRVALQTTLGRSPLGRHAYKAFMLFFVCYLAAEKGCAEFSSDLLQFMSAKISRRLHKLGSSTPDWLAHVALQTCTSIRSTIEYRWKREQVSQRLALPWIPSQLDFAQDIRLTLSNSRRHLAKSLSSSRVSAEKRFQPRLRRRGDLDDFLSISGKFFDDAYAVEPHITLYDVDRAVELGIDGWVTRVTDSDEACAKLEKLALKYTSSATGLYTRNPELLSVMLLTLIELWIALDKIVVKEIPMLADYSPEVPISLLEHLLLRKSTSLRRLRKAHEYLHRRHAESRHQWSVFSSIITADNFAVRYYRTSPRLQRLKTRIEEAAQYEVRRKVAAVRAANDRRHRGEVQRRRDRTDVTIGVYRWPLPADQLQAEAVAFELDCPVSFNMWRTVTSYILIDLFPTSGQDREGPSIKLNNYEALAPYLVKHPRSRISLGSDVEGFDASPMVSIPAREDEVCIENMLTFCYFDERTNSVLTGPLLCDNIGKYSTYELPVGPYESLQRYVGYTSHTSNEVVANQADCHEDLPIHEYMAFGHLRSGGLLQWFNVLRELRARSLNYRRAEVHMLFAQAASQVGPLDGAEWAWHHEIKQPTFCYALLRELESLLRDVEANWMEGVTMDTISFLLRRLLVSSPDESVSRKSLDLLRVVRAKLFSWVLELFDKLANTPGDEWLRGVLRDTAAICRGTYDVNLDMVPNILQSAEDMEVFISTAIIIQEHISKDSSLSNYSKLLLDRNTRLSLDFEDTVRMCIQSPAGKQGFDNAVAMVWTNYHAGSKWSPLPGPNSRWLSCKTAPPDGQRPEVAHFNMLDGSLLVDGKPLGRCLPEEFMRDSLYNLIFGNTKVMVIRSNLPGTSYYTRNTIFNHVVYFSRPKKGFGLVIRAKRKSATTDRADIIELVPPDVLRGDLPNALIEGQVHWLNLSTSVMEVRPLDKLWRSSPENWRINCIPGRYRMWKGREYLVDIRSPTWKTLSNSLRPLGPPQDLVITASPTDPSQPTSPLHLCVALPRYDLAFFVDADGDLQSRNFRGMVCDENQSIGTLFGLINKFVLRPKNKDFNGLGLIPRCVIIPEGKVKHHMHPVGHHIRVQIELQNSKSTMKRITYQTYNVNTELGCLVGNGSLTSKLYCAYLHALTSGLGADPLTGRSGTEEALTVLQSAGCCSYMMFGSRDADLLSWIASICPSREWNSKSRPTIQEVLWRELPEKSQNPELYFLSESIKSRYQRFIEVFDEKRSPPDETASSVYIDASTKNFDRNHLLKRSAGRAAYLSGSATVTVDRDLCEDLVDLGADEHRACTAAACVHRRTATSSQDVWGILRRWAKGISGDIDDKYDNLSRFGTIQRNVTHSPGKVRLRRKNARGVSRDPSVFFRYDKSWLAPDLPSIWLKAYNILRSSAGERKWFQMLFSLSAMAYASPHLSNIIPIFVAFASQPLFRLEDPPHYDYYPIILGYQPSMDILRTCVIHCTHPFEFMSQSSMHTEGGDLGDSREVEMYNSTLDADVDAAAQGLLSSWPCETPPPCSLDPRLYNIAHLEREVQPYLSGCFRNLKLKEHVTRVQTILNNMHSQPQSQISLSHDTVFYSFCPSYGTRPRSRISWHVTVDDLLARPAPQLPDHNVLTWYFSKTENTSATASDSVSLHRLIDTIQTSAANQFQHQYVSTLRSSAESFKEEMASIAHRTMVPPTTKTLIEHYYKCRVSYTRALDLLQRQLGPTNQSERAVEQSGQWPSFTPYTLFRYLASNSPVTLPDDWKRCLITFALLALALQRARRLLLLHFDGLREEFFRELENEGCDGWEVESYPDWLLIQLQGNFLIRRVQADVAGEMISPSSGENTAMQLNMGEGKSSVIVPISAAVLADGGQLVRIIVPKPVAAETSHLLVDRLGGLTNRRIYHLPFSRSLFFSMDDMEFLHETMLECMRERGILVVQPDHILSLRLATVEKQLPRPEGERVVRDPNLKWLEIQKWLHAHSRDILDEIDGILDVRSELVFTIGRQRHVEGSPERWTTIEQVLRLVGKHATYLRDRFPCGVEYEPGPPGTFPHLRILQADAGKELISWIVQDVLDCHVPNISLKNLRISPDLDDAIQSFISCEVVPPEKVRLVKEYFGKESQWTGLLLLRGLLASGILLFALMEKRWRVDYGLATERTMLAVPYRAKDVPSQRAEFGHPDAAILLTYLSYYYHGLSEKQLKSSFEILLEKDDPSFAYNLWVRACNTVPQSLRTLSGINMKSAEQWNRSLYPLFSRNWATINFYLSNVVFPRTAVEFPSKLSSSGWDLAEKKARLVTGFSGTNDGQHLFPVHITQHDPDHQRGTNAKVLSFVLQPENSHYMCINHEDGKRRTAHEFLQILVAQKIRVLLDVGAQMLDLENHELAKAWLDITPLNDASAAIYFNTNDELMVSTRDGSTQLLRSSPFAHQIDRCLAYLDDAHTRGTNIKFPSGSRAAVTLGPRVTKDRLVQGCMRMRMLGHGHSIMFFAPTEVDQRIRAMVGKTLSDEVDTKDILHWAIRETWHHIQRWAARWVQQGADHSSRHAAWSGFCDGQLTPETLSTEWLRSEARTLEDLYGPRLSPSTFTFVSPDMHQRCIDLGVSSHSSIGLDEEQEREVEYEVGREQQRRRLSSALPAAHSVHPDVANFVMTGIISAGIPSLAAQVFIPVWDTLHTTCAATSEPHVWSQSVLATTDFAKTVDLKESEEMDDYLRPVHWVVSAKSSDGSGDVLVIMSPHEANCLLPDIRSSTKVRLHVYIPCITKSMKPSSNITLYSIPSAPDSRIIASSLMNQLSVFAGQLYLNDHETYIQLCHFLGVYARDLDKVQGIITEPDGFILPKNRSPLKGTRTEITPTFEQTPLPFLKALMNLRCKRTDYKSTHMGRLLHGRLLSKDDFDH